jgi:hypothetical protein
MCPSCIGTWRIVSCVRRWQWPGLGHRPSPVQ